MYLAVLSRSIVSGEPNIRKISYNGQRDDNLLIDDIKNWIEGGEVIQNTPLGLLSADDREFIMTGMTPEEWDKVTKED